MRPLAVLAVALAGFLSGCGAEAAPPQDAGVPVSELRIGMQEYRFQLSADVLRAGPVTVVVTNAGSTAHDVVLVQDDTTIARSDMLSPGDRQTLEVQVTAGSPVALECTIGGHSAAGMHTSVAVASEDVAVAPAHDEAASDHSNGRTRPEADR